MTQKILTLVTLFSLVTLSAVARADEPAPAPLNVPTQAEIPNDPQPEIVPPQGNDVVKEDGVNALSRRVARRDYGLVGYGAVAASGGMLLGYAAGIPAILVASDYDVSESGRRVTFFATAGVVSAATTLTALKIADASWTTSIAAAGATMGTAAVGLGAATFFAKNDKPNSLVATYFVTLAAAGVVTAGTVALVKKSDEVE